MSIAWPWPGGVAMAQRRQDRGHGVHAGEQVGDGDADLLRPAAGRVVGDLGARRAGDAHQPAHALDRVVVAGAVAVRAGLAEAGDRAVDQARVEREQRGRVEAVAGHVADLEVLDQDIRAHRHRPHQRRAFGRGQVDRDRALVAVGAEVVGGLGVSRPSLSLRKGGPQPRVSSPPGWSSPGGRSTLITSAPRSARTCVHHGPASTRDRSSTRTPASACGVGGPAGGGEESRASAIDRIVGVAPGAKGIGIIDAMSLASGWRDRALPTLWLPACARRLLAALDWREVRPEGTGVTALFPAVWTSTSAACASPVSTCGCSSTPAMRPARPSRSPSSMAPSRPGSSRCLAALKASVAANIGGTALAEPFTPPGATPNPSSALLHVQGRLPDGRPVTLHAAFFVHGVRIYQAAAIGEPCPKTPSGASSARSSSRRERLPKGPALVKQPTADNAPTCPDS
jgi:hypothetical protein